MSTDVGAVEEYYPELGRDAAPLGTVLAAPEDRLNDLTQIMVLRLVVRATGLDQRLQHRPLCIRQNHPSVPAMSIDRKDNAQA